MDMHLDCTIWGYFLTMILDAIFGSLVALLIEVTQDRGDSRSVSRIFLTLGVSAAIGGFFVQFIHCRGTITWV